MFRGLRNAVRLWQISRALAGYRALAALGGLAPPRAVEILIRIVGIGRAGPAAGLRPGERLALAFQTLGPVFVKLGQLLSVRTDLIGEATADDLSRLQDRLPPFAGDAARAAVVAEFERPLERMFRAFDAEAVAAASIAQVHRAVTAEGREVAVKILRPGIERAFARDLDLLLWLAERLEATRPALRRLRPVEAVRTLGRTVEAEMDLRFEAAAADELRQNLADQDAFRVPTVDWTRTGRRVLTTAWVTGIPIDERRLLIDAGLDLRAIVANMAKVFFVSVFRDGFFHADLHPGNLFVDRDGAIHAVDFGIMGRLDKRTRRHLAEMLLGFLTADYRRVAEAHFRAGYVPPHQSVEAFAQAARSIAEPILGLPLERISLARLLAQLFEITRRFDMETRPELLLLQKTMLVAEGVGRHLQPDVNMWDLARPLIEEWMAEWAAPEARLRDAAFDLMRGLERLPQLLADIDGPVGALAGGPSARPPPVAAAAPPGKARWPLWAGAAAALALIAALAG